MMKKILQNKKILACLIAGIVVIVACIGSYTFYRVGLNAPQSTSKEIQFEVKQGDSINLVISNLKDEKLLKNDSMAQIYVKIHKLNDIKAGMYLLNANMDLKTILNILEQGDAKYLVNNLITFKEGMWAKDIAKSIEKELDIPAQELIDLWNDEVYIKELMNVYPFLSEDLLKEGIKVSLEGYLFPQTYRFDHGITAKQITAQLLDQFNLIYQKYESEIKASDMSIQDIIKLASMVQYEAKEKDDMKLVSGVFLNRMNIDQRLESSVTVCYSLYEDLESAEDCEVNTNIDSPYNTYINDGLPIGAILNPGEDAIEAVLNPTKSDNLYFIADIYGDGSMHYAKTFEDHEANINKYGLKK